MTLILAYLNGVLDHRGTGSQNHQSRWWVIVQSLHNKINYFSHLRAQKEAHWDYTPSIKVTAKHLVALGRQVMQTLFGCRRSHARLRDEPKERLRKRYLKLWKIKVISISPEKLSFPRDHIVKYEHSTSLSICKEVFWNDFALFNNQNSSQEWVHVIQYISNIFHDILDVTLRTVRILHYGHEHCFPWSA